ncbi:MAG: beta-N-acetylglucosaminidase, partial [Flavobacteriales bacterium CG11_big_fil_rev_8_21_14_0_20_35_7]
MQFKIKFLICFVLFSSFLKAQETNPLMATDAKAQQKWVDSIYKKLSLNDKIGQLFMMEVYSNKDAAHILSVKKLIKKHHIGSLIFMQGSPLAQAKLTNEYQALSKIPLLIGIDAEWGLNMRLDSTYRFPWNMTLGAIKNDSLLMALGKRIGEQCKRLGIHVNFAPVVDVNTNPLNPIIGNRSYGQDPKNVGAKALAFMKGIQSQNVLTTAKHFPGHGDTSTDSHQQLPIVLHTKAYMDSVDLAPYKTLIKNGLTGVMVAHLNVPSLDAEPKLPTSLSAKVIDKLLKKEMGFKGLVFTDALNMKGVANFGKSTTVDLKAFVAGNDVLMFSEDIPKAINKIKEAINAGAISPAHLENAVKKILMAKYWVGLNHYKPILEANLTADLATISDQLLERKLMGKAITLVKNQLKIFPIADVTQKIAYVKLGDATNKYFLESLKKYT